MTEFTDIDLGAPIDISIPLRFNGGQPNAYGVPEARSAACEGGGMIGDVRRGGSVNFEEVTLIPHCNGTHTECVGHITSERISVADCLRDAFVPARLISVQPDVSGGEAVIAAGPIERALEHNGSAPRALIVRTLPNDDGKLTRRYDTAQMPAYFSLESIEAMVGAGIRHLLCDLPSIDRMIDGGRLANHRCFWNVEPGSTAVKDPDRMGCTITELIYVPDTVEDGDYWLNLQIPPFVSDAAPSRPMLFRRRRVR